MNRDEFYATMALSDEAGLRKVLWTLYWRGDARLRERIEDELRPPDQPKVKPKKKVPVPDTVLIEVTEFVTLARDGAYMAGDRRVHHTERSKWRLTFRRLAVEALTALQADNPGPAQQAVAEIIDLACETKIYDYFHSDDPVEGAKFVVSEAVAELWKSVLRHDGFAVFASRVPEQLVRWEAKYGWTRRGFGQVAEKETQLAVPLARLLSTPDMWRAFAESYLEALDAAGRADLARPRNVWGLSTRLSTCAASAPAISPCGTRCYWNGSRVPRKTACWTGSPRARRWPGQICRSCGRRSRGAGATFPEPSFSSPTV